MGFLRFCLAIAVVLSHAGFSLLGFNIGVMAVVVFYAISGYVMSALIAKHFASAADTGHFYLDRLSRIYPQYAFYAGGAALWLFTVGHPTHFLILNPQPSDWLNNLLVVPLNYFMFNGSDRFTLVPPAWSLGAELLFYALAPWLWRHWHLAVALGLASLGVQALAWHGLLNSDWWGYRLLPGVLWVFVLGMALQRSHAVARGPVAERPLTPNRAHLLAIGAPLAALVVGWYLSVQGLLVKPYHREVLTGLALAIPLLHALSQRQFSPVWQRLDNRLGDLSYGIFLNHFLVIWVFDLGQPQQTWAWALLIGTSVLLSALSQHLIERPVLLWRRNWRVARAGKQGK